jgi:ketosteroid isomerase-like protein
MATRTAEAGLNRTTVSPVVERYFASFNAADYGAIADLFEPDGILMAPFEDPIVGPDSIRAYLQAEANHMQATAVTAEGEHRADGDRTVVVKGRVKALLFTVAVQWIFVLSEAEKIRSAEIKLLASLQELMQFDRGK